MLVLGIESSCDETGLALVEDGRLADQVLASQADVHALFGGVVPELASREHLRFMGPLFDALMERAGRGPSDIDCVAVARGPGLLGCLLVGAAFAKGICLGTGARLVGVDHLMAHLLACGLSGPLRFPAVGLLVSGGHTNLYRLESATSAVQLGRTLDDAAGEAFDKSAKTLGLGYPGGALMDELSRAGRADPSLFPRPCLGADSLDFSFSGLKTALCLRAERLFPKRPGPFARACDAPQELKDLCASFSLAVVETLEEKARRALDRNPDAGALMVAGGVAANSLLRERMAALAAGRGIPLLIPERSLCTDNAAMIAHAGWLRASGGLYHGLGLEAVPRGRPVPDDAVRA